MPLDEQTRTLTSCKYLAHPISQTHIWIVKTDRPAPQQGELKENPKGDGDLYTLADLLGDD